MKKLNMLLTLTMIIFCSSINAQSSNSLSYPKVGDTIADHLFLDVENFPEKSVRISDFRGKWLILDFWSYYCGSCLASFPKMNQLHKQYKDKVQVLMIGLYSKDLVKNRDIYKLTKKLYHKMKSKHKLDFPVAFDSAAIRKYKVGGVPYILVVDPEGVIVAKTLSINAEQVDQLLQGNIPPFRYAGSSNEKVNYNQELPLLTRGMTSNGGNDTSFLFRSLLMPYNNNIGIDRPMPLYFPEDNKAIHSGRFELDGVSLKSLYLWAYFGNMYWGPGNRFYGERSTKIILEVKDSSNFIVDRATNEGLYAYSLIVPKHRSSAAFIKQVMQSDLHNYFGYEVSIEERMMPAYHLVVTDSDKIKRLKTKGGKPVSTWDDTYFGVGEINHEFRSFVMTLLLCLPTDGTPLIDKTGIDYNIDIFFKADMSDIGSVNKALANYGLQLKSAQEKMETLVIRDPE